MVGGARLVYYCLRKPLEGCGAVMWVFPVYAEKVAAAIVRILADAVVASRFPDHPAGSELEESNLGSVSLFSCTLTVCFETIFLPETRN